MTMGANTSGATPTLIPTKPWRASMGECTLGEVPNHEETTDPLGWDRQPAFPEPPVGRLWMDMLGLGPLTQVHRQSLLITGVTLSGWRPPTPSQTGPQFCPKECTTTTEVAVRCCRVRLRHARSRTQADRREVVDGNAPSRRQCRVEGQAVR